MNNSYSTLALRRTNSNELKKDLNAENDIKIAYPTQTLFMGRHFGKIENKQLEFNKENLD